MAELIKKTDNLNQGREKLNAAITDAEVAKSTSEQAVSTSNQAKQIAQTAEDKADSVQTQFNQVVIEGDSSVEAAQARVSAEGTAYGTLKDRLDSEHAVVTSQLADDERYLATNITQRMKGSRPIITFILDDGKVEDLTKMLPIARAKNVPFVSAVITNRIGSSGYLSVAQIKELVDSGYFEIISHSHNHINFRQATDEEIISDLTANVSVLRSLGFKTKGFVYPYNEQDDRTIKFIQQYYDFAFCRFPFDQVKNHPRIDNQKIDRVSLGSFFDDPSIGNGFDTSSFEYAKYRIDECKANSSWLVFALHPADTTSAQMQVIEDTIDYAKSLGIDILNSEEAFNIQGNIIQTRDFAIDKNGRNVAPYRQITEKMNAYDGNVPIGDYPKNAVITHHVNNNGSSGFPQSAGTVITYNLGDQPGWGHQEYKAYASFNTYYRWATADGVWGSWQKNPRFADLPTEIKTEKNEFTATSPLTSFPANKITVFYVDSTGAAGFPHTSGIVMTIRVGNLPGYSKQIFWGYAQNFNYFFRRVDLNGNWGEWQSALREEDMPVKIKTDKNAFTANTPLSQFPANKITTFFVNSSGAAGFPNNLAGTVIVYNLGDDPGYARQEYRGHNKRDLWARYALDNSTWASWERIGGV